MELSDAGIIGNKKAVLRGLTLTPLPFNFNTLQIADLQMADCSATLQQTSGATLQHPLGVSADSNSGYISANQALSLNPIRHHWAPSRGA